MKKALRRLASIAAPAGCAAALALTMASCGGDSLAGGGSSRVSAGTTSPVGGTTASGANVASVIVDGGPSGNSSNTLFTSVQICVPGSSTACQTIDHIEVDTGSYGLRILAPVLTLSFPVNSTTDGQSLLECAAFVDGYSWGPVVNADVTIGGESAQSLPIQLIGDSRFPAVPSGCSSQGAAQNTVATFGANGILGVGTFAQDCGSSCATAVLQSPYYGCTGAACQLVVTPIQDQVTNPVAAFAVVDNNGSIIALPSAPVAGEATLSGSLIFGIDTQSNNQSSSSTVLTLDESADLTIEFQGQMLPGSFIDSGSNGIFFSDASLPTCAATDPGDGALSDFYCPATTQTLSATLMGVNGVDSTQNFNIGNTEALLQNASYTVLPALGGTFSDLSSSGNPFDWGLPFFYGRRVTTALDGRTTSVGTGPYIAF